MEEISAIAGTIVKLTTVSTSIASAVQQQSMTTRGIAESIHDAAGHTARASVEINSVDEAVMRGAAAVGDIATWTERLSARANDLEIQGRDLLHAGSRRLEKSPPRFVSPLAPALD